MTTNKNLFVSTPKSKFVQEGMSVRPTLLDVAISKSILDKKKELFNAPTTLAPTELKQTPLKTVEKLKTTPLEHLEIQNRNLEMRQKAEETQKRISAGNYSLIDLAKEPVQVVGQFLKEEREQGEMAVKNIQKDLGVPEYIARPIAALSAAKQVVINEPIRLGAQLLDFTTRPFTSDKLHNILQTVDKKLAPDKYTPYQKGTQFAGVMRNAVAIDSAIKNTKLLKFLAKSNPKLAAQGADLLTGEILTEPYLVMQDIDLNSKEAWEQRAINFVGSFLARHGAEAAFATKKELQAFVKETAEEIAPIIEDTARSVQEMKPQRAGAVKIPFNDESGKVIKYMNEGLTEEEALLRVVQDKKLEAVKEQSLLDVATPKKETIPFDESPPVISFTKGKEKYHAELTPSEVEKLSNEVLEIPSAKNGYSQIHLDAQTPQLSQESKLITRDEFISGHPQVEEILSKSEITTPPEIKTRGLSIGIEAKAIEKKLATAFEGLPEYEVVKVKEQALKADRILKNDYNLAKRVAMGEIKPPEGVLPESMLVAVEHDAVKRGDVYTLLELATNSKLVSEATEMGQRIRMLAERNPESAVSNIQRVQKERIAVVEKRSGNRISFEKKKQVGQLKERIKKAAPTKQSWNDFIDSITC